MKFFQQKNKNVRWRQYGSALLLLCFTSAAHAVTGLTLLKHFMSETKTLTAQFEQQVYSKNGQETQKSTGTVALVRPHLFRWDIAPPHAQRVIGDGKRVWIYDPDLNQVSVKKMQDALGQTPASFLAGANDLEKRFILTELGETKTLTWIEATPRDQDKQFEKIRLGFKTQSPPKQAQLVEMLIEDTFGQRTHIRFYQVQQNIQVDTTQFRFTPPKGADVLE